MCDEFAFDDLYGKLVYDAKSEVAVLDDGTGTGNYIESLEEDVLYDVLNTLYGRLTCLGLSCEHIGVSNLLATSDAGGGRRTLRAPTRSRNSGVRIRTTTPSSSLGT